MSFRKFLIEGKVSDIKNLQPNTKIDVFHGSSMLNIIEFASQGIDARKKVGRLYPHFTAGKKVDRGLFVSPDLKTALRFGDVVIKFTALGKELFPMYGTRASLKNPDPYVVKKYPNSFRPAVSFDMLERGVGSESQALYISLLSPRAITKVYTQKYDKQGNYYTGKVGEYKGQFNRSEFLKWVKEIWEPQQSNTRFKRDIFTALDEPIIEPQEANYLTPEKFYQRVHQYYDDMPLDKIKKIIFNAIKRDGDLRILDIHGTVGTKLIRKIKATREYKRHS
jgi:hypothetical protein